jgi:hypothetical protein
MPVWDRVVGPNPGRDDGVRLGNRGILSIFTLAASARREPPSSAASQLRERRR